MVVILNKWYQSNVPNFAIYAGRILEYLSRKKW